MTQTTRLPRLLVAGVAVLALSVPVAFPLRAHAGSATNLAGHSMYGMAARPAPGLTTLPPFLGVTAPLAASIPVTLQVPAGNVAYLLGHATGVQIYTCTMNGAAFAWSSSVPAATLFNDEGDQIATHYAGPTWQANDGSTVVGHKLQSVTVTADAIPWLLLSAASTTVGPTGGDTLSETTYIQRLYTRGGLTPPAGGCDADHVGVTVSVPYSAIYVFYQAVVLTTSANFGAVGQSITVTGTNFQAGEPVQVYWDVTGTTPLTTGVADANGTFAAALSIPAGLFAVHAILVIGQTSGATDFAYVQVEPRLVLTPVSGSAGTQVVATGDGFGAAETVNLYWDSTGGQLLGTTTSDASGSFSNSTAVTFTVPAGATTGTHVVYSLGQSTQALGGALFVVH
jgi:hypothetical protein